MADNEIDIAQLRTMLESAADNAQHWRDVGKGDPSEAEWQADIDLLDSQSARIVDCVEEFQGIEKPKGTLAAVVDVLKTVMYDLEERSAKDTGWRPRSLSKLIALRNRLGDR